jgi:hypothetical protein
MLKLVPAVAPSGKAQVTERIKKMPRPDGALQCNRCGSRTSATIINGARVENGRVQGGTEIHRHVCFDCIRQGIYSPMLPDLKLIE